MMPVEQPIETASAPPDAGSFVCRLAGRLAWPALILAAIAIRAWLIADTRLGHDADLRLFLSWTRGLATEGLGGFFASGVFCDYPPLSVLMFLGVGQLAALWPDVFNSDELLRVVIKAPACLADLAIGVLIFIEVRRWLGRPAALAGAGLFLLNPVVLYDSAVWGQVDAVYTAAVLAALALLLRQRWGWAGAVTAAGLLLKFQTIALIPLLLLETYRRGGWRGVGHLLVGGIVVAAAVLAPFALTDTLNDVLARSYIHVVGQYNFLSKGAYNIWPLIADAQTPDNTVPTWVVQATGDPREAIPTADSWLFSLTWRKISLLIYTLAVAVVLSLYTLRPGPIGLYGAAALLGLAFFLFPTEMHERYFFPALAFGAIWAVSSAWAERTYFLLCSVLLLNIALVLPATELAGFVGGMTLALFVLVLAMLAIGRVAPLLANPRELDRPPARDEQAGGGRLLIPLFRWATAGATVSAIAVAGCIGWKAHNAPSPDESAEAVYLAQLPPTYALQGWGSLQIDRSVAGGPLHLGGIVYRRGLGTHAPARLEYEVPAGMSCFRAVVGINETTEGRGSVVIAVDVDGQTIFTSDALTGNSLPLELEIPVVGAKRLVLRADATEDGPRADHVDWALARFAVSGDPAFASQLAARHVPPTARSAGQHDQPTSGGRRATPREQALEADPGRP